MQLNFGPYFLFLIFGRRDPEGKTLAITVPGKVKKSNSNKGAYCPVCGEKLRRSETSQDYPNWARDGAFKLWLECDGCGWQRWADACLVGRTDKKG